MCAEFSTHVSTFFFLTLSELSHFHKYTHTHKHSFPHPLVGAPPGGESRVTAPCRGQLQQPQRARVPSAHARTGNQRAKLMIIEQI